MNPLHLLAAVSTFAGVAWLLHLWFRVREWNRLDRMEADERARRLREYDQSKVVNFPRPGKGGRA